MDTLSDFETYLIFTEMENRDYDFIGGLSFNKKLIAMLFGSDEHLIEFRALDNNKGIALEIGVDTEPEDRLDNVRGGSIYRYYPDLISMAQVDIHYDFNSEHIIDELTEKIRDTLEDFETATQKYHNLKDTHNELKPSFSYVKPCPQIELYHEANEYYNT